MSELKTYRVDFSETRIMRIRVKARSAQDAIKQAEYLYLDISAHTSFVLLRSDPFHDAEAKQLQTFADIEDRRRIVSIPP